MRHDKIICLLLFTTLLLSLSTVMASDITESSNEEQASSYITVESSQELADTINDDTASSDNPNIRLEGNGKTYDLDEFNGIDINANKSFNTLTIDGNNNILKSNESYICTGESKTLILKNIIFAGNPSITNYGITKVINCTFKDITSYETIFENYNQRVYIEYIDGLDYIDSIDSEGILEIYNSTIENLTLPKIDYLKNDFIENYGTNLIVSNNIFTNCNSNNQESSLITNNLANMTISNNIFKQNNLASSLVNDSYDVNFMDNEEYSKLVYVLNNTFDSNKYSNALILSNDNKISIRNNKFLDNVKLQNNATIVRIFPESEKNTLDLLVKNNNIFSDSRKNAYIGKSTANVKTFSPIKLFVKKTTNKSYKNYLHTFKHDEVITLAKLNELFNRDFTGMHLLIYVDGVLLFNSTVSDDLSMILFKLEDILIGHHILKIVTLNTEDNNTYQREIYIN